MVCTGGVASFLLHGSYAQVLVQLQPAAVVITGWLTGRRRLRW
jgi:hypothetical protein